MIRWMQPSLGATELRAIREVFKDGWPGAGPRVKAFTSDFAAYVGAPPEQFVAISSCTEGLFLAIAALELEPEDEVIMPTISYVGAAHAVRSAGAKVRLADVDLQTLNSTPDHIRRCINERTRAVIMLHYGGRPGWIEEIAELARQTGILLIEDAACGLAASAAGRACGALGDIGIWSFDSMKLLAAGDGGMIRVADEALRVRIDRSSHLGGVLAGLDAAARSRKWWEMDPHECGRRAFMNDLTASIARVQLNRLPELVTKRRAIVNMYMETIQHPSIRMPPKLTFAETPYFFWIQTDRRNEVAWALQRAGIYSTFRYWPLHRMHLYHHAGVFPGADEAADTTLLLPLHGNLSDEDIERICHTVLVSA